MNRYVSVIAGRSCLLNGSHSKSCTPVVGGKQWRYLLIPHDAIAANMTLNTLVLSYSK